MMLLRAVAILAMTLSAGCGARGPATIAALDTRLPPGNAVDVAVSPSERFLAATNPLDGSATIFMLSGKPGRTRVGDMKNLQSAEVDFPEAGTPERVAWTPGINHGEALYIHLRGDAGDSIRRVYASGEKFSLGIDEEIAAAATDEDFAKYFAEKDPVTVDERLRIREEIRRAREHTPVVDLPSDAILDACAWTRDGRRFVFATFADTNAVAAFDATQRGQAKLVLLIPARSPAGLAVASGAGILFVGERRTSRVLAIALDDVVR